MATSTQQKQELFKTIWSIANELRGSVDGWDFKQYVLGMLFYRYISENITNMNTTRTEGGGAYRRKLTVMQAETGKNGFREAMSRAARRGHAVSNRGYEQAGGVKIGEIAVTAAALSDVAPIAESSDGTQWSALSAEMSAAVHDVHGVYFVFSSAEEGTICKLDEFTFEK